MPGGRKNIIESAVKDILEDNAALVSIFGDFGTGKSHLIGEIISSLEKYGQPDHYFSSVNFNASTIMEFAAHLTASIQPKPEQGKLYNFVETYYNLKRSTEVLSHLLSANEDTYVKTKNTIKIKENYDHFIYGENDVLMQELEIYLENAADRRLVGDSGHLIIESLIIDLINLFYPGRSIDELLEKKSEKKFKVIYIFDESDHIFNNLKDFIDLFIKYCREIPFSDYTAFGFQGEDKEFALFDLIEVNFIIATRFNHDIYSHNRKVYRLEDLSREDFDLLMEEDQSKQGAELDKIYSITSGNLMMMRKYYNNIKSGKLDEEEYYKSISNELFKYNTETEKDILKVSAYLEAFDIHGLRSYSILKAHADDHWKYILQWDMFEKDGNLYRLNEKYAVLIRKIISILQNSMGEEYHKISKVYHKTDDLRENLETNEFDALRTLAYFKRFDNTAIEKTFLEDAAVVFPLFEKKAEIFIKHKHTRSLTDEIKDRLTEFNKYRDLGRFDKKKDMIQNVWKAHEAGLKQKIVEFEHDLKDIDEQISLIHEKNSELGELLSKVNNEVIVFEEDLIKLGRKLDAYRLPKEITMISVVTTVGIMLIVASFFLNNIFGSEISEYWKYGLIGSGSILLLLVSRSIFRIIKYNSNVDKVKALAEEQNKLKKERDQIVSDANRLKADLQANEFKLSELEHDIVSNKKYIDDTNEMLKESFI